MKMSVNEHCHGARMVFVKRPQSHGHRIYLWVRLYLITIRSWPHDVWLQADSSRTPNKGHPQRVLSTQSLCIIVLARNLQFSLIVQPGIGLHNQLDHFDRSIWPLHTPMGCLQRTRNTGVWGERVKTQPFSNQEALSCLKPRHVEGTRRPCLELCIQLGIQFSVEN